MRVSRHPLVLLLLGLLLVACVGCSSAPDWDGPQVLGDQSVSVAVLDHGYEKYTLYCRACHGDAGDGLGPASHGMRPPPRNFQQGLFKFGWVVDGMPRDEDLARIIRSGLHGTPMLEWELNDDDLHAVIQYVKTFSEDWREEDMVGRPVEPPADPWEGKRAEAVAHGDLVYHGLATCWSCHPAYATREQISAATTTLKGVETTSFRPNLFYGELKGSDYVVGEHEVKIMPTDFTSQPIRSLRAGSSVEDMYRLIGAGIPGTAMPAWDGAISGKDLWALAYYVDDLHGMRDTPQAVQLRERLLRSDASHQEATGL